MRAEREVRATLPEVPDVLPNETEQVVSWIRAYRRRYGRSPKIPEVQAAFKGMPKTTVWRRLQNS